MMRPKESLALRAGVVLGMTFGFCFAAGVFLLVQALRSFDPFWAKHPALVYLFGAVPLFWLVWGVRLLKKVEATD